jgi:hypothetical protein
LLPDKSYRKYDLEMRGEYEEVKTPTVQVDPKDESVWDPDEPTFFEIDESETKLDPYK